MSEQFGNDYVVLTDEDGNEVEFEHIDTVEVDGTMYMAFIPAELAVDEEAEVVILKVEEEDGEEVAFSRSSWSASRTCTRKTANKPLLPYSVKTPCNV